ncbi:hypothetical protein DdX_11545 [Ditylenchus destructor]|uniref:Uncharacterized protein n=1 Tax=Ditylenchus destructor TaxID=166010 RepID=A0AAD4N0P5_9BILA|nr:hypothetical protein DdX_11545 [Ditylenchus destructor]
MRGRWSNREKQSFGGVPIGEYICDKFPELKIIREGQTTFAHEIAGKEPQRLSRMAAPMVIQDFPEAISYGGCNLCRRDRYQSSCLTERKRLTYHMPGTELRRGRFCSWVTDGASPFNLEGPDNRLINNRM